MTEDFNKPTPRPQKGETLIVGPDGTTTVKKENKKTGVIAGVVIAIVIVVAAVVGIVFALSGGGLSLDSSAQEGQAPFKTPDEIQAELDRVVEEGMFNIAIAGVIDFEDGTSGGKAFIENVPGNRYNMQVIITSDDDPDKVWYESGLIQPNHYIEEIKLSEDLDAGSYPATATFLAFDTDSNEKVGQAAAKVTLNVKN